MKNYTTIVRDNVWNNVWNNGLNIIDNTVNNNGVAYATDKVDAIVRNNVYIRVGNKLKSCNYNHLQQYKNNL
jgi:hypothetical protein